MYITLELAHKSCKYVYIKLLLKLHTKNGEAVNESEASESINEKRGLDEVHELEREEHGVCTERGKMDGEKYGGSKKGHKSCMREYNRSMGRN